MKPFVKELFLHSKFEEYKIFIDELWSDILFHQEDFFYRPVLEKNKEVKEKMKSTKIVEAKYHTNPKYGNWIETLKDKISYFNLYNEEMIDMFSKLIINL